ncbi:hypothetical protein [Paenibacillus sp. NPDC058071]|uniref:hypothetical protein n=1 Tax=Paenibacillus sp. NPDC058071 TaxID=3346326 RepID=UPI0036DAB195
MLSLRYRIREVKTGQLRPDAHGCSRRGKHGAMLASPVRRIAVLSLNGGCQSDFFVCPVRAGPVPFRGYN